MDQYAFAKMTLRFEGLPEMSDTPSSAFASNGMQRIVALVSLLICYSYSYVPSQ